MAFLTATTFQTTGDDLIDLMTSGIKWDLDETRTISWAVADGLEDSWDNRAQAAVNFQSAIDSFAAFVDVRFDYVGAFDSPVLAGQAGADVVYTLDIDFDNPLLFASAYYPGPGVFDQFELYPSEDGDIFMNLANTILATSSFQFGSDGFYTIIHELGHAMGLKHPFEEERGRPSLDGIERDDILDAEWFSIMSYTDAFEQVTERWDPATPMVLDVLALQFMYGQNTEIHAGHTTHVLESVDYQYAIWDPSGFDTVDASALSEGWRIVLPEIEFTPLVDTLSGYALPRTQFDDALVDSSPTELVWLMGDIEDVRGSDFDDVLIGSRHENIMYGGDGNDELEGLAGNDSLVGDDGHDTAFYSGHENNYTIWFGPGGTSIEDRRAGGNGEDLLRSIETLSFYEGQTTSTFDLEAFSGPADLSGLELEALIELYIAYFNRAPDAMGLWFWGNALADGTVTLEQAAAYFIDQDETRDIYPAELGNTAFATQVYANVLGRAPDTDGLNFWVDLLDRSQVGRDHFILEVLRGAKADPDPPLGQGFADQQLTDRAYLATKTDIGALYAVHRGMSNVENASAAMALFDGTQDGLDATLAAIAQHYSAASDPENGELLLPLVGVLDNAFELIG